MKLRLEAKSPRGATSHGKLLHAGATCGSYNPELTSMEATSMEEGKKQNCNCNYENYMDLTGKI